MNHPELTKEDAALIGAACYHHSYLLVERSETAYGRYLEAKKGGDDEVARLHQNTYIVWDAKSKRMLELAEHYKQMAK